SERKRSGDAGIAGRAATRSGVPAAMAGASGLGRFKAPANAPNSTAAWSMRRSPRETTSHFPSHGRRGRGQLRASWLLGLDRLAKTMGGPDSSAGLGDEVAAVPLVRSPLESRQV